MRPSTLFLLTFALAAIAVTPAAARLDPCEPGLP